jgi:hypothetical protein
MSNERTMEELIKDLKLAVFTEMVGKCKCRHDDDCKLNAYLWEQYTELVPDGEISENSSVASQNA